MTVTYGVWVPAGLFLPGIIIGCTVGAIYEELNQQFFPTEDKEYSDAVVPVLLGIGGMISAYCRMTYALAIIMMETTASINIFVPMFISIMTARVVAGFFGPSLYVKTIRMKEIPILPKNAPYQARNIVLADIMRTDVTCLTTLSTVDQIIDALHSNHSGYPVLNTAGRLVGLIPSHILITLVKNRATYDKRLI